MFFVIGPRSKEEKLDKRKWFEFERILTISDDFLSDFLSRFLTLFAETDQNRQKTEILLPKKVLKGWMKSAASKGNFLVEKCFCCIRESC